MNAAHSVSSFPVSDFNQAYELICRSWGENPDTPLDYKPEILESWIRYTHAQLPFMRGLFAGETLIACVAGLPRTFVLNERTRRLLLLTWFTVDPEWKRRGLGRRIWSESVLQARAEGYDGTLHYCVEGNPSNGITAAGAAEAGFQSVSIYDIPYLMRITAPSDAMLPSRGEPEQFLRAVSATRFDVPFVRQWTPEEAAWACNRPGAICVASEAGETTGAIAGYVMQLADKECTPCAFVEDILWGDLQPAERDSLAASFLSAASGRARIVILPNLRYADLAPFERVGFRRSRRVLHTYLTLWEPWTEGPLPGMYADVI